MSRYTRHTQLKDFGPEAQSKLSDASVLVIGAGGLGIPVIQYLNAMGVGKLTIVDGDKVSLENLHRQVIYGDGDIGKYKAERAEAFLLKQRTDASLEIHTEYLHTDNALKLIEACDLVVDASDNFATRYLINDACIMLDKPFIYGGLHSYEGQVSVFNYKGGPSYRCLFPNEPNAGELPDCNTNGVLGILPGIIGSLMALEAVKVISGREKVLSGKLLIYNGKEQSMEQVAFKRKEDQCAIDSLKSEYAVPCSLMERTASEVLKDKDILILDVRSKTEYEKEHLPAAVSAPLEELDAILPTINREEVHFICETGVRSAEAIRSLSAKYPHKKLIQILGGMQALRALEHG